MTKILSMTTEEKVVLYDNIDFAFSEFGRFFYWEVVCSPHREDEFFLIVVDPDPNAEEPSDALYARAHACEDALAAAMGWEGPEGYWWPDDWVLDIYSQDEHGMSREEVVARRLEKTKEERAAALAEKFAPKQSLWKLKLHTLWLRSKLLRSHLYEKWLLIKLFWKDVNIARLEKKNARIDRKKERLLEKKCIRVALGGEWLWAEPLVEYQGEVTKVRLYNEPLHPDFSHGDEVQICWDEETKCVRVRNVKEVNDE